ncbi:hypothetical protein HNP46_004328 [Pseudomonas nitritireducens]|uniref:Uncharacterized protein n=1 Tax=Pseudomonas nitroreducens TaxID=46680 RepID=A0A7W7P3N8_PSENT|nr:hypothetical protein [Pseudomonas nitritireducens]MBB4865447.1 hypothetical protein [Pseudomonas nitritireducens]
MTELNISGLSFDEVERHAWEYLSHRHGTSLAKSTAELRATLENLTDVLAAHRTRKAPELIGEALRTGNLNLAALLVCPPEEGLRPSAYQPGELARAFEQQKCGEFLRNLVRHLSFDLEFVDVEPHPAALAILAREAAQSFHGRTPGELAYPSARVASVFLAKCTAESLQQPVPAKTFPRQVLDAFVPHVPHGSPIPGYLGEGLGQHLPRGFDASFEGSDLLEDSRALVFELERQLPGVLKSFLQAEGQGFDQKRMGWPESEYYLSLAVRTSSAFEVQQKNLFDKPKDKELSALGRAQALNQKLSLTSDSKAEILRMLGVEELSRQVQTRADFDYLTNLGFDDRDFDHELLPDFATTNLAVSVLEL